MLQFNPYFRPTAKELLKSDYFDDVRKPNLEGLAPEKLLLDTDTDQAFDHEAMESNLSSATLQSMLNAKVLAYL